MLGAQLGFALTAWKLHTVDFVILFFTTAVIFGLSHWEIRESLRRIQRSEIAIREERNSLERQVEERTRELKKVQLEKLAHLYRIAKFGKLSCGIFHDLVNPLTAVAITIEDLKCCQTPQAVETRQRIDQALKATERMKNLVAIINKQIQEHPNENAEFSVVNEIREVIDILAYKARGAGVTLSHITPNDILLFGNALRFHQTITNIVANAIDACENNSHGTDRHCTIQTHQDGGTLHVAIKNNGPKIPEHILPKIFEPFFTTKPAGQGNGIGLSLVKDIMEKEFGGSVDVQSAETDTLFILRFPLRHIQPLAPE